MKKYGLLCLLDGIVWGHGHENAINKDSYYDEKTEQRMDEHVNCNATNWVKWIKNPQGICCTKSEYIFPLTNNRKRL